MDKKLIVVIIVFLCYLFPQNPYSSNNIENFSIFHPLVPLIDYNADDVIGEHISPISREYLEDYTINQYWDSYDLTWDDSQLITVTAYNSMNLPLEIITQGIWDWLDEVQNTSKRNYDYNQNGDVIYDLLSTWFDEDSAWVNNTLNTAEYNALGLQVYTNYSHWAEGQWLTYYESTMEWSDTGQLLGLIIDSWTWEGDFQLHQEYIYNWNEAGDDWVTIDIYFYYPLESLYETQRQTNLSGQNNVDDWLFLTEFAINDSTWINDRLDELHVHMIDGEYYFDEIITKVWTDSSWIGSFKSEYTYMPNDRDIEMQKQYGWEDSDWVVNFLNEYTYTDNGNLNTHQSSHGGFDEYGDYMYQSLNTYTYDEHFNQIELLNQNWQDAEWNNSSRKLSYYQYVQLLGDINGDDVLDVLDIVNIINLILSDGYDTIADLNTDDTLNILDIVLLVNTILNS